MKVNLNQEAMGFLPLSILNRPIYRNSKNIASGTMLGIITTFGKNCYLVNNEILFQDITPAATQNHFKICMFFTSKSSPLTTCNPFCFSSYPK